MATTLTSAQLAASVTPPDNRSTQVNRTPGGTLSVPSWLHRTVRGTVLTTTDQEPGIYRVTCSRSQFWNEPCQTRQTGATGAARLTALSNLIDLLQDSGCPLHGPVPAASVVASDAVQYVGTTDGTTFPSVTAYLGLPSALRAVNPAAGAGEYAEWQYNRGDGVWYPLAGLDATGMS